MLATRVLPIVRIAATIALSAVATPAIAQSHAPYRNVSPSGVDAELPTPPSALKTPSAGPGSGQNSGYRHIDLYRNIWLNPSHQALGKHRSLGAPRPAGPAQALRSR